MDSPPSPAQSVRSFRFWILPLTGMLNIALITSDYSAFGLIFLELEDAFQVSKFSIGWTQSLNNLTGFFTGMLAPALIKRFGNRTVSLLSCGIYLLGLILSAFTPNFYLLYLFHGVITGFGLYIFYIILFALIQDNVKINIVMANAVVTTGYGIGGLLWPVLYKMFVDAYTWRGAFLLMAAIGINYHLFLMIQTSSVLNLVGGDTKDRSKMEGKELELEVQEIPQEEEPNSLEIPENEEQKEVFSITRTQISDGQEHNKTVKAKGICKSDLTVWDWLITVAYFLYYSGEAFSFFMIGVRMKYINLTKDQIVATMSAGGAIGLFKIIPCYLIDRFKLNRTKVVGALSLLMGIFTIISVSFTTFVPILVFYVCLSLMKSVFFAVLIPVFVDVFGEERVHKAMGFLTMAYTLGTFCTMPLCGFLLDVFGDINIPILLFGGLQVAAALLIYSIAYCRKPPPPPGNPQSGETL